MPDETTQDPDATDAEATDADAADEDAADPEDPDAADASANGEADPDDATDDASEKDAADEESADEVDSDEVDSDEGTADDDASGEEAEEELSEFLQAVKTPISEDEPGGASITYDEDFRKVKQEIDNISSPGAECDYADVRDRCRLILKEKSKDLRAAGYLVIGEARTNGASGYAEGMKALRILLDEFWEELYPAKRRMRGRGSAIQVISDRLQDWARNTDFDADDRASLESALADLKAIQEFGMTEMGEHAPAVSGLVKATNKAIDKLPEPEPEPDPEPEPEDTSADDADDTDADDTRASSSPSSSTAQASSSGGPAVSTDDLSSESDVSTAVFKIASHLRGESLKNPVHYHLMRAVQWGTLDSTPPNENGQTRIPAPREQRRSYLTGLLEQEKYEELVREGESAFQEAPFHFWLDLQRLVGMAMSNLGKPYEAAHSVVIHSVAMLVKRLPKLSTLSFSDGTPFAGPMTQEWIESQVMAEVGGGGDGGGPGGNGQMPVMEQYEEARSELGGGDLGAALAIMKEGEATDRSDKENFYRRLYTAMLCMKSGQPAVARPMLDELDAAIERHSLAAWDPSLAVEVWTQRCQCYDALAQDAEVEMKDELFRKADASFEKICRVDAEKAVSVAERRPR